MPTITIKELVEEVTDEQKIKMARIEGLIKLREGLREDREALREIAGEVIEQRREEIIFLGLDISPIDEAFKELLAAVSELETSAQKSQMEALKS